MTPTLLREVGEAMYGSYWQTALARDLQVADRTMRRWAAGNFNMPPNLKKELANLIEQRGQALAAVREKLI